jgi:hypothetical protein
LFGIAVNATDVYFTESFSGNTTGAVRKVAVAGGTPSSIAAAADAPGALVIDANNAYWVVGNEGFTGESAGAVKKVPLAGGTIVTLAVNNDATIVNIDPADPVALAVDATSVYWVNYGSASVFSVPIGGGTPVTLATQNAGDPYLFQPNAIAVDGTSVYVAATGQTTGAILKVTPK